MNTDFELKEVLYEENKHSKIEENLDDTIIFDLPLKGMYGFGMMFWKGAACFKSQTSSCD